MVMGFNWFVIWSPMFAFLIFDRILYYQRPGVLICYNCRHNFRGLDDATLEAVESFDLEVHDRFQYIHENQKDL